MHGYDLAVWELLVRRAGHADLLARLGFVIADAGLRGQIPEAPLRHIDAAIILADKQRRDVLWEIRCLFSDIDILNPSDHLAEAQALSWPASLTRRRVRRSART